MSTEWRSARIAMLMAKLERHRDNIARLEERKAKYGLNVPLELENELADEQKMAMEVDAQLQHLIAGGEDPLDRLFHEATRARIKGQVGRALQLYKQIQREDPTYPDIEVHVRGTERELAQGYIDNGGRVISELVLVEAAWMGEAEEPWLDETIYPPSELEMIFIPAGEFLMGSDPWKDTGAHDSEQPQHTLYLPGYYLAKVPVTNAQYAAFVQATGHGYPEHWEVRKLPRGKEDHPVVNVSWYGAVAYCNWLSEVTGKPYRLPSEAEWEKGARGSDGRIYPWDDQWDAERCNSLEGGKGDTAPVGAYPQGASPYGLLDMAGNVMEWTRSVYKSYPYDPEDGRENLRTKGHRVLRGGSFMDDERLVRCAHRLRGYPLGFNKDLGFRVMVSFGPSLDPENSGL